MFSIEFLNRVRNYEIEKIAEHFPPGATVLEIGGGTGYQAKQLADRGFVVTSIDVSGSNYRDKQVFPVLEYDGKRFPFERNTFDLVFSSNVLEHVVDLSQLHQETRRVLKPDGYCIHVMPTSMWRFWTSVTNYVELAQRLVLLLPALIPESINPHEVLRPFRVTKRAWELVRYYAVPPRHGEIGSVVSELWTFSSRHWLRHFTVHQFEILGREPLGLSYTGHMVLGSHWSIPSRQRAAKILGSSCFLYKVKPRSCDA
ncbi:MAG: class I SAM-dependent methyltransferase [Nitrospira sp.]|nr:class I SAM-dependent methyltransferase [Nitrospira sp.]